MWWCEAGVHMTCVVARSHDNKGGTYYMESDWKDEEKW